MHSRIMRAQTFDAIRPRELHRSVFDETTCHCLGRRKILHQCRQGMMRPVRIWRSRSSSSSPWLCCSVRENSWNCRR